MTLVEAKKKVFISDVFWLDEPNFVHPTKMEEFWNTHIFTASICFIAKIQ